MDLLSIAFMRTLYRALHPTRLIVPRVLQSKQIKEILSHMEKNKKDRRVYNVRRIIQLVMFLYGTAYTYYNLCNKKYICIMCHLSATQALAWVGTLVSRGLACHVTSTCACAENAPFLHLIQLFSMFKIRNKFI